MNSPNPTASLEMLSKHHSSPHPATSPPRLAYSTKEVAAALGIAPVTVRRMAREKRIHATKVIRHLLIAAHELERLLGQPEVRHVSAVESAVRVTKPKSAPARRRVKEEEEANERALQDFRARVEQRRRIMQAEFVRDSEEEVPADNGLSVEPVTQPQSEESDRVAACITHDPHGDAVIESSRHPKGGDAQFETQGDIAEH